MKGHIRLLLNYRPAGGQTGYSMKEYIRKIIEEVGEDPERQGLVGTPERVDKAFRFLTSGYTVDPEELLNNALFDVQYDEMVIVSNIDFFSMCEHHLLPFFGKCHVGYLPDKKVIGISKIVRLVEMFSRRFQVQERLTTQIAKTIEKTIKPLGVGVIVEAQHMCMLMRGVEKQNSRATTSSMLGNFRRSVETRMEFLDLVYKRGGTA
jgi:GTP cyclohydrolase I